MSVTTLAISEIKIGERFRKNLGDLSLLERSIKEVGLLHPIVVDQTEQLVAGRRRLEVCKRLGMNTVPVHRVNLPQIATGEFHENAVRKAFTASEIVAIKRTLEPTIREEARKRQGRRTDLGKELPAESARSRDAIAEYVGTSHDTLAKMERLVEAAETDQARFGPILQRVDEDQMSLNKAMSIIRGAETASPEPAPHNGKRQRQTVSRAEDSGEARSVGTTGSKAATPTKHLKVMKKFKEKPQLSAPSAKTSQAILDTVTALHCPHCGAESTQVVWKCCQTPFKQEEQEG